MQGRQRLTIPSKIELRRQAQRRRDEIHARLSASAAGHFLDHGLDLIRSLPGQVISGFWPIRSEPDIRPLLEALSRHGRQIALPVVVGQGMALGFQCWTPADTLVSGPLGTACPAPEAGELQPDIMLVPLLAFDAMKHRLGYGGGYYDRTIAGLRQARHSFIAIGIAYTGLEITELPTDPWDQPLDAILTEEGLRYGLT